MSFTTLKSTQKSFLESHLRGTGRAMSAAQASETYGIKNLRARIHDLRQSGLRVSKQLNTAGRYAYTISRRDVAGSQAKIFA